MENNQENDIISRLFQKQRQMEQASTPPFSEVYGKAKQKHLIMKRTKWLVTVAVLAAIALGIVYGINRSPVEQEEIPLLRAGVTYYDRLMKDGKIVTNDIHFAFDRAELRPQSMSIIDSIAAMMKKHPEIRLSIEGHTDNVGSSSYNLQLSAARALAVKHALTALSIEESRLLSKGLGDTKPAHDNESDEGRARNRRVEFVLIR